MGVTEGKKLERFDLKEIISFVAKEQKIKVTISGEGIVQADIAIYSIFENLFRNVRVHAEVDKVEIDIKRIKRKIEVRFSDEGKGIDPDIKDKLFVEGVKSSTTGVNGLGLYVVKNTIERYGGNIRFEDNKPKGAVFILEFVRGD